MFSNYIIFKLFVHLFTNYVIFTLRKIKYQFDTKYSNNKSHYVKLTLVYVTNLTQKF